MKIAVGQEPKAASAGKKLSSVQEDDLDQWGSRFLGRSDEDLSLPHNAHRSKWNSHGWCKPAYIPISMILILIVLVVLLPLLEQAEHVDENLKLPYGSNACGSSCRISLVESIPEGLNYPAGSVKFPSTYDTWSQLINISKSSIDIASLYWTLRGADVFPHPSAYQGEDIFNKLMNVSIERDIKLRIAQNSPSRDMPCTDTEDLERKALAEVRSLNFPKLLGGGVLHTKFWVVDRRHVYIGSANMDWRSLTQVKEMGAVIYDCPCIANDILKIFNVYWDLGKKDAAVPPRWPDSYSTPYNMSTPMNITLNDVQVNTFLSSSPPPFSPVGRAQDGDTIVNLISKAEKFVYISVMDYIPLLIYSPRPKYWPVFDNALIAAAINNKVTIRVMASAWNHTRRAELKFLRSLEAISDSYKYVKIEVKLFSVPATPDQKRIPFARVNHNKYMVTDNAAYIGTSNWSGDYFTNTAGVGLVMMPAVSNRKQNPLPIRDQLQAVFERDWNSPYARYLSEFVNETMYDD